jgi:putative ABC transport system permease protein
MYITLAFRRLVKTPFVTAVAALSLALGIGANAAIFSLFDQTLLRSLPVADPGRLVNLSAPGPKPGSQSCGQAGNCDHVFSYPMFKDLERTQQVFTGIAGHVGFGANLAFQGQTRSGGGMLVSGSYFPVLGLQPALGRLFTPDDDRTIGGQFVAVLSHSYWTTRLGGRETVLSQTLIVNGKPMTIVGVAPRGFSSTTLGSETDVFVPITMREQMLPNWKNLENRRAYWVYLFARLEPGVTIEQASAGLEAVYRPIVTQVEAPLQKGMSDQTMARFKAKPIVVTDGRRGQSTMHREAQQPMNMLMAITGIVLVIACANIANLLLARASGRATEMAVRLSIGASRRQLLTQLLTESVVLALVGGFAGLFFARWTLLLLQSLLPDEVTSSLSFQVEPPMVALAVGLALVTGLLFGLFPALHSTRPDLVSVLKAQAGQPSGARTAARFRATLVTAQIGLSMALLVLAGLFVKSLSNVSRVDLGVNIENLVTFGVSPSLSGYTNERCQAFFIRAEDELGTIPGVTSVAASMVPLLSGSSWGTDVGVQGFQRGPDIDSNSRYNEISPGYFRGLGVPLVAGREFTAADTQGGGKVAIVNEAFARKFNLGRDVVGRLMGQGAKLDTQIVGFVQDAKYSEVKAEIPPTFYLPYRQNASLGGMHYYVRASGDPAPLLKAVTSVIARLDPNLPVESLKTMPQQVRENVFLDRMISTLAAAFAVLATLLAAIGLYGVLAYTVAQRTREIGLRMALGADSRQVKSMVLRQVAVMTVIGGLIGAGAAIAGGMKMSSLLYGLTGYDPIVIAASAVVLVLVALAAGYVPAHRASRVDPMSALRYE